MSKVVQKSSCHKKRTTKKLLSSPVSKTHDDVPDELSSNSKETQCNSSVDNLDALSTNSSDQNEETSVLLNSALKPKKKVLTDETKYKTEVCRNWSETGQCPYGKKCKFAHGKQDLNEKTQTSKVGYKSKRCTSFHHKLTCMYGVRCLFSHEQRTLGDLSKKNYYQKFLSCPALFHNSSIKKGRLPIFPTKADKKVLTVEAPLPSFGNFKNSEEEFESLLSSFTTNKNYFIF